MNSSTESYLCLLLTLHNESLFEWEAEITLVIYHWQRILQSLPPLYPPPLQMQQTKHDNVDIQDCLRHLYHLSDQELLMYKATIIQQILPRLQVLQGVRALPDRTPKSCNFVQQLNGELEKVIKFYVYDWSFIIYSLKRAGDPRLIAVALPKYDHIPFPQMFLYVLGCRHHALAYWKQFGKRHWEESRSSGKFPEYAKCCGLDPELPYLQNALKIGQRLLFIEEKVNAPGISLVMTRVCRTLLQLRDLNIKQIIFIITQLLKGSDVGEIANGISKRLLDSQNIFDEEVAVFLSSQ